MKPIYLLLLTLCSAASLNGQIMSTATGDSGSGYPALLASGFEIEDPDCVHTDFGPHVTQAFDEELDRNVFVFHSHIEEDNDRCRVFDRVRMEIKGSANSDEELQHPLGSTSWYRWKFRLAADFIGASSFSHLFQNKAVGGSDTSFPVLTITARANRVELKHDGGQTGAALGAVAQAPIELFRGRWVECYMRQVHGENGELELTIKDMATGQTILEYQNDDIDLWRAGASFSRPKWGIYRSKNTVLRDEEVRFANFCVSETAESLCPGEAVLQTDTEAPTAPQDLAVTGTTFTSIDLSWSASTDEFGVTGYEVFQDDVLVTTTTETTASITGLGSATTYSFYVRALDEAGNASAASATITATTDDATALPDRVFDPTPADGATDVGPSSALSWSVGANTDEFEVYFGTDPNPPSLGTQTRSSFQPQLEINTTYYWRVDAVNVNGASPGPVWQFTTGAANKDFPWSVFRGNARPEVETNFWSVAAEPASPLIDEVVADPDVAGNSLYGYRAEDGNFKWRFNLSPQDTAVTFMARLRGVRPDVSSITHLELRLLGFRQKVRLNKSNIKLERSSPALDEDLSFNWNEDFHLIRVVVDKQRTSVYLDENSTPFITGLTSQTATGDYVEFGKSGGADYGATVDWMAVYPNVAFAPGQGDTLPGDLLLSNGSVATYSPDLQAGVSLFPNPASQTVTLTTSKAGPLTVQLFSLDGRAVSTKRAVRQRARLDVGHLNKGLYIVVVTAESGRAARLKLLID